jgi:tetratricopeptide (TPR) repeat protein
LPAWSKHLFSFGGQQAMVGTGGGVWLPIAACSSEHEQPSRPSLMQLPQSVHHPDPAIDALVREVIGSLPQVKKALETDGVPPGSAPISREQQDVLFQIVQQLCDQEHFFHAAPLALFLAVHHPKDRRYSFCAGRAFQRLAAFDAAVVFYEMCLQEHRAPVVMYRLGECLAGLGRADEAIRLFDAAFDLARGVDQYRSLQDAAEQAIDRLRSTTASA